MNKTKDIFTRNLVLIRLDKGYTRKQAAQMMDLSYTYLSALEKGEKNPTFDTIDKIANAYNILPDMLFCQDENEYPSKDVGYLLGNLKEGKRSIEQLIMKLEKSNH